MIERKLSRRETWLLAILPASLILVVSLVLPSEEAEVVRLQSQIKSAPNDAQYSKRVRDLTTLLNENRKRQTELEEQRAVINAELAKFEAAPAARRTQPLAECFQVLNQRLSSAGVMVVATEVEAPKKQSGGKEMRRWKLTLAGTWEQVSIALDDDRLVPDGLHVASLRMHDVNASTKLRRWTLTVSESDRS